MARMPSITADSPLGALLRLPLRLVPAGAHVPILTTRARGLRWIAGSGPHGCWLGINEVAKRRVFQQVVVPGMVVWDVGANVGSYTLLGSVCAGTSGQVVAIEPVPANLRYLRAHIARNRLRNVRVLACAVSDRPGAARFRTHPDRLQGRVAEDGGISVEVITFDALVERRLAPPPDCIKIDIEGGELAALRGGVGILVDHRPVLFVATHGAAVRAECIALLEALSYDVEVIGRADDELIARPRPQQRSEHGRRDDRAGPAPARG